MDKSKLKSFAIWARRELIKDVTYKAGLIGITENEIKEPVYKTNDLQMFDIGTNDPYTIKGEEIKQRNSLVTKIREKGFNQVVEEIAYTWFNRIIAIRYMEVNDYLPTKVRVLSSETAGKVEPDMVTVAPNIEFTFTDTEKFEVIPTLKHENKLDDLFKLLFIKQCNELNKILPVLFERTNEYLELLLNISFSNEDGVVRRLINDIDECDFMDQVEIIGWLYQYYNIELKDEAFLLLKNNVKISKYNLPAVTQLFTPDWIVRYMVENSLGRMWLESHPNNDLLKKWKYYVQKEMISNDLLEKAKCGSSNSMDKTLKDLKILDPCMGSGHILVYVFDVLMQIYESIGYSKSEAAISIIENNLYGLDIDNRALQLSYFAVLMRARKYSRKVFNEKLDCKVFSFYESNKIKRKYFENFGVDVIDKNERFRILSDLNYIVDTFYNAKEFGSLISFNRTFNFDELHDFIKSINESSQISIEEFEILETIDALDSMLNIAKVVNQKYDIVVTNPPYMGNNSMNSILSEFVKAKYPNSKNDLFAAFLEKMGEMTKKNGIYSMIVQPSILYLSSFALLRKKILLNQTILSMLHLGRGIFGIDFGSVALCIRNELTNNFSGDFYKLHERTFQYIESDDIEKIFLDALADTDLHYNFRVYNTETGYISVSSKLMHKQDGLVKIHYNANQEDFLKIPNTPIAYWMSSTIFEGYKKWDKFETIGKPSTGMMTANNDKYLRKWYEINYKEFIDRQKYGYKWIKYLKGGPFRRWYGNLEYLLKYNNDPQYILEQKNSSVMPLNTLSKLKCTWSDVTSGKNGFRIAPIDSFHDKAGHCFYPAKEDQYWLLGLTNSNVFQMILNIFNQTIHCQAGDVAKVIVPYLHKDEKTKIASIVEECITISKLDWDSYEYSWDFTKNELIKEFPIRANYLIKNVFEELKENLIHRFNDLKEKEEMINTLYMNIYGLTEEMSNKVEDDDVTVKLPFLINQIRDFISYVVGCMLGRYSLDCDGLVYAGGEWDASKYTSYIPDKDNCIPITDEEYFEDDIVGRFVEFVKVVYGQETLEENLDFIAKALGGKGDTSRETIRNYFIKDFFKDHLKTYQKRPIYWQFDSGKENGFKALIYMHRYNEDTVGTVRTEYLHKLQKVYESEIDRMDLVNESSSNATEKARAIKRKEKLTKQLNETNAYDAALSHIALQRIPIDLDDGVKVNYAKFQDIEVSKGDGKKAVKVNLLSKI